MEFSVVRSSGSARAGLLTTERGNIKTPVFMPVGTHGTVKGLCPAELKTLEVQILLGNAYHLMLRPGLQVIENHGGLHNFMGWNLPILSIRSLILFSIKSTFSARF